jgi:hypothetical protein
MSAENLAADRLAAVRERIDRAARASGRDAADITLIAVSKRQPIERVALAVAAGVTHLGENYVQELRDKRAELETRVGQELAAGLHWHMIGGLQRNKARIVVPLVDTVESVDRESLAVELDRRAAGADRVLPICIQVNLSREPQKSGVDPDALPALLEACEPLSHLRVEGLMTVPAASDDPPQTRGSFARLRELRDTLRNAPGGGDLRELSMGMSGDFEIAIEEGATRVRVGTLIFGPRDA